MKVIEVIQELKEAGIRIWEEGGVLKYKCPAGVMNEELKLRLRERKPEIIDFLVNLQAGARAGIGRRGREEKLEISPLQKWLWLYASMHGESGMYNIPVAFRLTGSLDKAALATSLDLVVARHEILRTEFYSEGEKVWQRIRSSIRIPLEEADLTGAEAESRVKELIREELGRGFDLEHCPLFRARLLRIAAGEWVLLLCFHHIICDNHSLGVFMREMLESYQALREERAVKLPELPIQYADFSYWLNERLAQGKLQAELNYWREQLGRGSEPAEIEGDYQRPEQLSYRSIRRRFLLREETTAKLRELCRQTGATLYAALLSVLKLLLHHYSGLEELSVGSPVAGRGRAELEGLIGLFFNTVVIRTSIETGLSFREWLVKVMGTVSAALRNQEVPFDVLVAELKPAHAKNRTPFFQVLFNMYQADLHGALPGLQVEALDREAVGGQNENSKFDITLLGIEEEGGLQLDFSFKADLYRAETVDWLVGHYRELLEKIAEDPLLCRA